MSEWISVKDRLPEEGRDVLVQYEYFRYGNYNRMYQTYGMAHQVRGSWGGDVKGTKARCLAWMPLPEIPIPEPPEESEAKDDG